MSVSNRTFVYIVCVTSVALLVAAALIWPRSHSESGAGNTAKTDSDYKQEAAENTNSTNKLRKVILKHESGRAREHLVIESDVDKLVDASIRLHHDPGVNPHNGKKAAKLETICVSRLRASGPFWWSTPGLKKNSDPNGAVIFTWQPDHCAFPRVGSQACVYCKPYIGW